MQPIADILQKILKRKAEIVADRKQQLPLSKLQTNIAQLPAPHDFAQALRTKTAQDKPAIIAEIKKASPSKGIIRQHFDPIAIAKSYVQAGAACLSILTDEDFFQGADLYLQQVRAICSLPLLRKDFIIDPYQIYESRYLGADCILLIVAALSEQQLQELTEIALQLKLAVLLEVHTEEELTTALKINSPLIGINNRNLRDFTTHLNTTLKLLGKIPHNKLIITESGIHTKADVKQMRDNGVHAFLVGEAFMSAADPGEKLQMLFS